MLFFFKFLFFFFHQFDSIFVVVDVLLLEFEHHKPAIFEATSIHQHWRGAQESSIDCANQRYQETFVGAAIVFFGESQGIYSRDFKLTRKQKTKQKKNNKPIESKIFLTVYYFVIL